MEHPNAGSTLAAEEAAYARYHEHRYALLLRLIEPYVAPASRILDIGRSPLTARLHERYAVPVDTLGFDDEGATATGRHYRFDLNAAQHRANWRTDIPQYDVVLLAEVLEHLYTSPALVLAFLRTLTKPGGILVVQTPNGLSLPKRIKPIVGIHPYDRIREDTTNPGHFREYTAHELKAYGTAAGFEIVHLGFYNYFDIRVTEHSKTGRPRWLEALKYHFLSTLPPFLKPGITMVLRRVEPTRP